MPKFPSLTGRQRAALAFGALVVAGLIGGWWVAMQQLALATTNYLDTVMIPGAIKSGLTLNYDKVEQQGLGPVYIRGARFTTHEEDGSLATLRADGVAVWPAGLRSIRLSFGEGARLEDAKGFVALYGSAPVVVKLGLDSAGKLPDDLRVALPQLLMLHTGPKGGVPTEVRLQQKGTGRIHLHRFDDNRSMFSISMNDVSLARTSAKRPAFRIGGLRTVNQFERNAKTGLLVDSYADLSEILVDESLTQLQSKSGKTSPVYMDIGWNTRTIMVAAPGTIATIPAGENTPPLTLSAEYMPQRMEIRNAYLRIANLPLLRTEGVLELTQEDKIPSGKLAVTIGGLTQLRAWLDYADQGIDDKRFTRTFDALQTLLASWGVKEKEDIVIDVTRQPQGDIKIGPLVFDAAVFRVMQVVNTAFNGGAQQSIPAPAPPSAK